MRVRCSRLDYRHFYENRAGFGIGVQHVRNYMDVDGSFGIPVSFVCRTELHDFGESVGRGVMSAIANNPFEDYDAYYMDEYVDNPLAQGFMSDVAAFLLGMVNRAEFAHIFPGIADFQAFPGIFGL